MLNFAAQAARDCRRIESDLRAHGYRDDAATAGGLADRIAAAEHFQLPDGGYLFDDDLNALAGLALRLPFPLTTIEFIARDPVGLTLRRLGLCSEFADASGALHIRVVAFARDEGRWGIVPVAIDFSADGWEQISADCTPFCEFADDPALAPPGPARYAFRPVPIMADSAKHVTSDRRALVEQIAGASAVAESLLSMLSALACSNVRAEIQERVDPAKNARRIRDGKLPLWETRVLTVLCPRQPIHRAGQQGDRASPRQHLRRGHVRHLADGRRIWIQAAVVGDPVNGRIRKFYDVRVAA